MHRIEDQAPSTASLSYVRIFHLHKRFECGAERHLERGTLIRVLCYPEKPSRPVFIPPYMIEYKSVHQGNPNHPSMDGTNPRLCREALSEVAFLAG